MPPVAVMGEGTDSVGVGLGEGLETVELDEPPLQPVTPAPIPATSRAVSASRIAVGGM